MAEAEVYPGDPPNIANWRCVEEQLNFIATLQKDIDRWREECNHQTTLKTLARDELKQAYAQRDKAQAESLGMKEVLEELSDNNPMRLYPTDLMMIERALSGAISQFLQDELKALREIAYRSDRCLSHCGCLCESSHRADLRAALGGKL